MQIYLIDSGQELCRHWRSHLKSFDNSYQSLHIGDSVVHTHPSTGITALKIYAHGIDKVTAMVSPGNSVGLMNGGLDKVLKDAFGSETVESKVTTQFANGYSPPGSSNLVHIQQSRAKSLWDAEYLVHLPTMRTPRAVHSSDLASLRMVYDWTWSILTTVERHNATHGTLHNNPKIGSLVMTGLATGYGHVPLEVAAKSMVAAIAIFYRQGATEKEKCGYTLKFLGEEVRWLGEGYVSREVMEMDFDPVKSGIPMLFMHTPEAMVGYPKVVKPT